MTDINQFPIPTTPFDAQSLGLARVGANEDVTGIWAGANAKSLAALKARSVTGLTGGEVIQLNAGGRSGQFTWVTGNQSARVTNDPREGIYIAPNSDPTGASGAWVRVNVPYVDGWVNVDWFGAVGDGSTDDLPAFNAAHEWLKYNGGVTKRRNGTIYYGARRYALNGTFLLDWMGITLKGPGAVPRTSTSTESVVSGGALIGTSTTGPIIRLSVGDICLEDVEITSNDARRNAAISRGSTTGNVGISMEPPDTGATPTVSMVTMRRVLVRNQPAEGIYCAGEWTNILLESVFTNSIGGHGICFDDGTLAGRTNKGRPGILTLLNCKSSDCGGHTLALGHPNDEFNAPYRPLLINFEQFRGATDAAQRYVTETAFHRAENLVAISCAFDGNGFTQGVLCASGRGHKYIECRYVNANNWVLLKSYSGMPTFEIVFEGGTCSGTNTRTVAGVTLSGTDPVLVATATAHGRVNGEQVTLTGLGGSTELNNQTFTITVVDATSFTLNGTDSSTVTAWTSGGTASFFPQHFIRGEGTVRKVTVKGVRGRYTSVSDGVAVDVILQNGNLNNFSFVDESARNYNNSGSIANLRGLTSPFMNLNNDEYCQLSGLGTSNQVNGLLRITQASGSTGDASVRTSVGANSWMFGQRRSNNSFCVRNSTAFSNAGNIVNIIGDGGTNGFVGIGPNTTVPAYRVDVDGSINVRTGGAFRFNGTQVVGARVINANIADPAAVTAQTLTDNSGGTASTTIAAIGAAYDQNEVRNAVASLADQINKIKADVDELRAKSVAANTTIRTHGLGAAS